MANRWAWLVVLPPAMTWLMSPAPRVFEERCLEPLWVGRLGQLGLGHVVRVKGYRLEQGVRLGLWCDRVQRLRGDQRGDRGGEAAVGGDDVGPVESLGNGLADVNVVPRGHLSVRPGGLGPMGSSRRLPRRSKSGDRPWVLVTAGSASKRSSHLDPAANYKRCTVNPPSTHIT